MEDEHDRLLRQAAFERVRTCSLRHDDLVPLDVLRDGFTFAGRRISFGSFYSGIYRPKELHGPAALALVTAPPKSGRPPPYEDTFDEDSGRFTYRFRDPGSTSVRALAQAEADNQTLIEAHRLGVPVVYFRGSYRRRDQRAVADHRHPRVRRMDQPVSAQEQDVLQRPSRQSVKAQVLDTGDGIAPRSLKFSKDRATLSWKKDGAALSAPFPPAGCGGPPQIVA